ncbi:hypothetical protein JOM56_012772 [Amanita muscaria]
MSHNRSHARANTISPLKLRSGRKRAISSLSDKSVKMAKRSKKRCGAEEEEDENEEKEECEIRNEDNEGGKLKNKRQQRCAPKTSATRVQEDTEAFKTTNLPTQ